MANFFNIYFFPIQMEKFNQEKRFVSHRFHTQHFIFEFHLVSNGSSQRILLVNISLSDSLSTSSKNTPRTNLELNSLKN